LNEAVAEAAAAERTKRVQWQMQVLAEQAQRLRDFERIFENMLHEQVLAAHVAGANAAAAAASAAGLGGGGGGAGGGGGLSSALAKKPRKETPTQKRRKRVQLPGSTWEAALAAFDDPDAVASEFDFDEEEPISPTNEESEGSPSASASVGAGAGAGVGVGTVMFAAPPPSEGVGALNDFSMMSSASVYSTLEAAERAASLQPQEQASRRGSGTAGLSPLTSRRGSPAPVSLRQALNAIIMPEADLRRARAAMGGGAGARSPRGAGARSPRGGGSPAASRRGSRYGGVAADSPGGASFAVGVSGIPSSVLLQIKKQRDGNSYRL
jgi:hypothetical protein